MKPAEPHDIPALQERHFLHALIGCMADPDWVIPWATLFSATNQRLAVVDTRGIVCAATPRLLRECTPAAPPRAGDLGLRAFLPDVMADELVRIVRRCITDDRPAFVQALINGRRSCAAMLPLTHHGAPGAVLLALGDSCFWPADAALPRPFRRHTLGYGTLGDLDAAPILELDLLRLLGRGGTIAEARRELRCTHRGAAALARSLRQRLNARSSFHVALAAIERGLSEFTATEWDQLVFLRARHSAVATAASS